MRYLPAVIVDAVLVLIFAVIGRASHDESPAGFLLTAWPFLVAMLVGHLLAALLPARPRQPWSVLWGVVVWVVTVIGGMLLRVATGDTAQVAFIIVATLTLGVLLVGWRAATALLRRRRASAATAHDADEVDVEGTSGV
jgi:FtsH-binding integral membrane protein